MGRIKMPDHLNRSIRPTSHLYSLECGYIYHTINDEGVHTNHCKAVGKFFLKGFGRIITVGTPKDGDFALCRRHAIKVVSRHLMMTDLDGRVVHFSSIGYAVHCQYELVEGRSTVPCGNYANYVIDNERLCTTHTKEKIFEEELAKYA